MLGKAVKMQEFIYNLPEAKCEFCKATENPHPDYDETVPITRIDIGKKRKLTLCINCFFIHKECSKKKDEMDEVIYIKYDNENMKYLYYCVYCEKFWKLD